MKKKQSLIYGGRYENPFLESCCNYFDGVLVNDDVPVVLCLTPKDGREECVVQVDKPRYRLSDAIGNGMIKRRRRLCYGGDFDEPPKDKYGFGPGRFVFPADKTRVVLPFYNSPVIEPLGTSYYEYKGYPYTDKEDFIFSTYNNWYNTALSNGDTNIADDMARFLAVQDAFESGYGTSNAARYNNFGGMRSGGANIKYGNVEDYQRAKYKMLKEKMPHVFSATSFDEFVDALNAGEYKYAPHEDGNANYERDLKNMKTAWKYLNKILKKK